MSAEFNWWLLIVGLVAGGLLTWLVMADSDRRERDLDDQELAAEAAWLARSGGANVDAATAERVLLAHRRYLGFPPPDTLVDPAELGVRDTAPAAETPAGRGPTAGDPGPADPATSTPGPG